MDNETMQDLIIHAYDQKPLEFQSSFNDLIADRIVKAVDIKKIEVAQSMFSDQPAGEDYESESDQEEQENGATA